MKTIFKAMGVFVLLIFLGVSGCGGGGGDNGNGGDCSEGVAIFDAMFDDFGSMIGSQEIIQCIEQLQANCPCPNGGTVSAALVQTTIDVQFANCISENNNVFKGYLRYLPSEKIYASFSRFGDCTRVWFNGIDWTACLGIIDGQCAGQDILCPLVYYGPGDCDIECDCW